MVSYNENFGGKIVRMLNGAFTPHIKDYILKIKGEDASVHSLAKSLRLKLNLSELKAD